MHCSNSIRMTPSFEVSCSYFVILAMVAIMAAMLDMLEPRLIVSATLILRFNLDGTTISQPGWMRGSLTYLCNLAIHIDDVCLALDCI